MANRGELVARIARTCGGLGIECLALVTADQVGAWWAGQTDGPIALEGTYLDAGAVLRAAETAGADAIHPGYGFLAENADFADAVAATGILWVGPSGAAMRALGDKTAGRRLAKSSGVPVLPGYDGADVSNERLATEAARIGYPLLVKPSAGGGGKGMHVVRRPDDLAETLARARREAASSFGDDRLILERYLERPRHVEIQLLLDGHGNGVHLGERDCSLQRRHQKVIEEAPSPAVDAGLRERLGNAALRLARSAGYEGAGTAEFLLDDAGDFYFLEVNARLQVEHPVTELVTGRDLVADQLRIASGETLGFAQEDVTFQGHAVEARLYAEDPWEGFLPATGRLVRVGWPAMEGVRVDAGVGAGDEIGTRYDPLLAKLIAHGADRDDALERLRLALEGTETLGVTTNRGFLRRLLDDPAARAGEARTDTIERIWQPTGTADLDARAGAAMAQVVSSGPAGAAPVGFRLNAAPSVRIRLGREELTLPAGADDPQDIAWAIERGAASEQSVVLDIEGRAYRGGLAVAPTVDAAAGRAQREHGAVAPVVASMPGLVRAVLVSVGESVKAGQTLVVLEAMKMENAVTAPAAATVSRLLVEAGQQVQRGDALVELE
ncbi:acetyl-CoA carboxylase biotin carboxylase subunit [soil metagenome]